MNKFRLLLAVLFLAGCSIGITVHDESRAAELVVDFLSSIKTASGIKTAYEWADDRFQGAVSFEEFSQSISFLRSKNSGADIRLTGFETFGAKEVIIVYADSQAATGSVHLKLTLAGTKHKDYRLIDYAISDIEFPRGGNYKKYGKSIVVRDV